MEGTDVTDLVRAGDGLKAIELLLGKHGPLDTIAVNVATLGGAFAYAWLGAASNKTKAQ